MVQIGDLFLVIKEREVPPQWVMGMWNDEDGWSEIVG